MPVNSNITLNGVSPVDVVRFLHEVHEVVERDVDAVFTLLSEASEPVVCDLHEDDSPLSASMSWRRVSDPENQRAHWRKTPKYAVKRKEVK